MCVDLKSISSGPLGWGLYYTHIHTHISQAEGARCRSMVKAFATGAMGRRIDPPLSYFSFQPMFHDWCNKEYGMCYPVCWTVHIKEPFLLIGKNSPRSGGSGFPLSLSEWSLNKNVLSAFLPSQPELHKWVGKCHRPSIIT